jgi:hypothetical protein
MPFSSASYDPETLAILTSVFDDAWEEMQCMNITSNVNVLRNLLAARIMVAAADGERDREVLKAAVLGDLRLRRAG